MKKTFAIIIAVAALFACSKADQPKPEAQKSYKMTIKASKDADTKALSLSGKTLNATWSEGEVVLVYQSGAKIGELTSAASSTSSTTLKGNLTSALDETQALTFYFHTATDPDYSGQDGTLATIASSYDCCDAATVAAGDFTISDDKVTVPGGISFGANKQTIVKFTLIDAENTGNKLNPSSLTVAATRFATNSVTPYFSYTFTIPSSTYTAPNGGDGVIYLAIPVPSALISSKIARNQTIINLIATVGTKNYVYSKAVFPFDNNGKYYEISVKMKPEITADKLGKIIGQDGNIYDNVAAAEAAGTNAGAMIAYVGLNTGEAAYHYFRGLAIALADCPPTNNEEDAGYQYRNELVSVEHTPTASRSNPFPAESGIQYIAQHTAETNFFVKYPAYYAAFYPPIYGSYCPEWCSNWFLGTGYQWQQMINNTGGFASFGELRAAIVAAGGTDLAETFNNAAGAEARYWTSTQNTNSNKRAWYFTVVNGGSFGNDWVTSEYKVRPIVAF